MFGGLAGCVLSTRFNMTATVLRQYVDDNDFEPSEGGYYETVQDPLTGAIKREWHVDDPDRTTPVEFTIPCQVRGVVDGGIRVAGTTERFGKIYENVDWARMFFPAGYLLTKRDRVTSIRNTATGQVIWLDTELAEPTTNPGEYSIPATVFNVNGVTPIPNPFGVPTENVALLERAEGAVGPVVTVTYG